MIEEQITDFMVRNITLKTMLYVLQVANSLHLARDVVLICEVSVFLKLILEHGLHRRSFKLGHRINERVHFFSTDFELGTRRAEHESWAFCIGKDSLRDAPLILTIEELVGRFFFV